MVVWVEGYYWVWVVGAIVLVVKCSKWLIVKWLYASSILSWLLASSGPFMCSSVTCDHASGVGVHTYCAFHANVRWPCFFLTLQVTHPWLQSKNHI